MTRILLATLTAFGLAADWPRFRGPGGAGVADPATPVELKTAAAAWKVPVGAGNGSPVVAGGKVYLQTATAGDRALVCFDAATGKQDWTQPFSGQAGKTHKKNSLASGTPAVSGDKVFVLTWDGDAVAIHAVSTAGKLLWDQSLGGFKSQHGAGHSPAVVGNKVVVNFDQDDKAEVVAFDAGTGAVVWRKERKAFRSCYSTPFVRTGKDGKPEVVLSSTAGITAYNPETGDVNWNFDWAFDGMALRTVGGPLLVGDVILAISGDGGGSRHAVAVEAGTGKLLWEKKKDSPYVPMPVAKGGTVYWVNDAGLAMAVDAKTGTVHWSERVFAKAVSASPLLVGDTVLAFAEDGKVVAFKASPAAYERVSETALGEAVMASPAAADGRLFVRGANTLFCFGK